MAHRSGAIQLGRAEPWVRALGLAIWAFLGISRLHSGGGEARGWLVPWSIYGGLMAVGFLHRRMPVAVAWADLVLQSACVAWTSRAGLPGFEGLMASLVAVQAPLMGSLRSSCVFAVVQVPGLVATVYPFKTATDLMDILGAYSTFTAFALLVFWMQEREAVARRELARANVEILSSRALLVEGVRQGERLRLSRELHDSLGHHLTALNIQLELASKLSRGDESRAVAAAREVSRAALAEVRKVVGEIQLQEPINLAASVRALAAGIPAPPIHVEANDDGALLEARLGQNLFRCVQEAVTNSLKHSQASHIEVGIQVQPSSVQVQVRDDGRGGSWRPGRGVEGIQARVAEMGGRADLSSSERGFEVRLWVPRGASP